MDAFLAEFKVYVLAKDTVEAGERIQVWRSLATACHLDPGSGKVTVLRAGAMPGDVERALQKQRDRLEGVASDRIRDQAIAGLASHLEGDVSFATELVESMEAKRGQRIPAAIATALAEAHQPEAAA